MQRPLWFLTVWSGAVAAALVACGGGGGDSASAQGTLRLTLTDAPACDYDNVWVTVERVRVHKSGSAGDNDSGWSEVVLANPQRIDLLEYTNGKTLPLGETQLPAGTYTQMRLVLAANGTNPPFANAIKPSGGAETALDTPSSQQSGLKFNVNMDVPADKVADFALDFDACRSFVKAGNSGKYLLKPVLAVIPVLSDAGQRIVGYVEPSLANGSTLVSAQQGGVVVKSTPPDATGKFVLYPVPAGSYDLVITAPGRVNAVMTGVPVVTTAITTVNGASAPLATPPSGASFAAKGTITVNASVVDTGGTVRALQPVASGPTIQAGIVNANAANGAYSALLPASAPALTAYAASASSYSFASAASGAGAYTLSATATGFATPKTAAITITNADVTTNFVFP
ncbi:MAG TPA: DUF4382 domain-containing protein [Burkholderiaceae bacterium]|nr:DUF4382 domain-containing protein [Burkholderiaceae bacterium]